MKKSAREKALLWAYRMDGFDFVLYSVGLMWFTLGLLGDESTHIIAATVFVGLLRIRMILRGIRVDALTREADDEARRQP